MYESSSYKTDSWLDETLSDEHESLAYMKSSKELVIGNALRISY
jgi:hypothetical protein